MSSQTGISQGVPALARYLFFSLTSNTSLEDIKQALLAIVDGDSVVVGLGNVLVGLSNKSIPGLKDPTVFSAPGIAIPAVPHALWFWLRGNDRGELVNLTLKIEEALDENVQLEDVIDSFKFDEAPESAHVKRAAQESFNPGAFMLRRSMPWADFSGEGLIFVAFGNSFYAFDTVMNQMLGINDGIKDGLFELSRCLGTGYHWCPPMVDNKLDLSAI